MIIPSRNERFLRQTVDDLLQHATQQIEIVVALDGAWPVEALPDDKRVKVIHFGSPRGMRACLNAAAGVARGEYLMKCDAHCSFQEGFDEVLKVDCADDWVVIPRRDRLDAENWCRQETNKPPIDAHYLSCPITNKDGYSMHGSLWPERDRERKHIVLDETMSTQGSCYFMTRKHWDRLGGLSEVGYGGFSQEFQEIGNKTWLGGGKVFTNKATTYLHLHKSKTYGRMYPINRDEVKAGHLYSARFWMNNEWKERVHDLEWLVDRFSPVPTWPSDWIEHRNEYVRLDL